MNGEGRRWREEVEGGWWREEVEGGGGGRIVCDSVVIKGAAVTIALFPSPSTGGGGECVAGCGAAEASHGEAPACQ